MPFRSKKTTATYVQRRKLVARLLDDRPFCEIQWDDDCEGMAVDVDELLGRGVGGDFLDETNCQTTCRYCHRKKHDNPAEAVRRGFTIQRRGTAQRGTFHPSTDAFLASLEREHLSEEDQ